MRSGDRVEALPSEQVRAVRTPAAVDGGIVAGTVAVALLRSMAVIVDASSGLDADELATTRGRELLAEVVRHADHVSGVLTDLVRGLPLDALEALGEPASPWSEVERG